MDQGDAEKHLPRGGKPAVGFVSRTIACEQTLGECLAQRRAGLGYSLAHVASELAINQGYLEALERGKHAALPGTVYALAFVKAYARLVGLDPIEAARRYKSELAVMQRARGEPARTWRPVRRTSWWQLVSPARLAKNAGIAAVLVFFLAYLGFKVEAIVRAPLLTVTSPADEVLTDNPLVQVLGQTEPGGTVTINGQEILLDEQGRFATPLDLQTGVNLIRITARKNHSNETVILRRVVLQENER